jgi:hypothetical protein
MPTGKRGDQKLHITFNEMGHGDNVLISLPNGKMVVTDCGSMRWDGNYGNPKRAAAELYDNPMNNIRTLPAFVSASSTVRMIKNGRKTAENQAFSGPGAG